MGYTHPIVALTANVVSGQKEIFLSNGFDDFIAKPIDSRELDVLLLHFLRDKEPSAGKQPAPASAVRNEMTEVKKYFLLDAENTFSVFDELKPKLQGVNPNLNDEEIELYKITVHGMKSALTNINENKLSEDALKLEQAGEKRDFHVIINETPMFVDALQLLVNKLKLSEET